MKDNDCGTKYVITDFDVREVAFTKHRITGKLVIAVTSCSYFSRIHDLCVLRRVESDILGNLVQDKLWTECDNSRNYVPVQRWTQSDNRRNFLYGQCLNEPCTVIPRIVGITRVRPLRKLRPASVLG